MHRLYVLGAAGAVVLLALLVLAVANPFSKSASDRIADRVGTNVNCSENGLQELAGERETVYRCSYRDPHHETRPYTVACFAVVNGRVYGVGC